MREVTVRLPGRSYPIVIGTGHLATLGRRARQAGFGGRLALVQDSGVPESVAQAVASGLEAAGFPIARLVVPAGEESKSLAQLGRLWDGFAAGGLDRDSGVVALGGGMIGDLAGFAAATYLRGIRFIQVPTTLLAQVDASVGGKTALDLPAGKNLVGAFHQPSLVLIDLRTLDTLPERAFRAGLAEVLKYGVIVDAAFFGFLESNRERILARQPAAVEQIIARSCEIKAEVVGQDEQESGLRAILNFGHTIGHAVEAVAGYGRYAHGEAVAIGMVAATWLSRRLGWLSAADHGRIERLIHDYGLPTSVSEPLARERLLAAMRLDKKARAGELRFVLARRIGEVGVTAVDEGQAREALDSILPREKAERAG